MATYYVDGANGNNSNSGTSQGQAWATLGKANTSCAAGDTINVLPGTYHEVLNITKANTTWRSTTKWAAVIDGYYSRSKLSASNVMPNPLNGGGANNFLPNIASLTESLELVEIQASGVVFDGFMVCNSAQAGLTITKRNVIVRNCRIDYCRAQGISVNCTTDDGKGVIVEDNIVTWCAMRKLVSQFGGPSAGAIVMTQTSDGCIFRRNIIAHSGGDSLVVNDKAKNCIAHDNVVHSCRGGGLMDEGSGRAPGEGALFYRNTVYYTANSGVNSNGLLMSCENENQSTRRYCYTIAYNNLFVNCGLSVVVRNDQDQTDPKTDTRLKTVYVGFNTFVAGPGTQTWWNNQLSVRGGGNEDTLIENNVFENTAGGFTIGNVFGDTTFRNNVWRSQPPASMRGSGDQYTNPQLVNPTAAINCLTGSKNNFTLSYETNFNPANYKLKSGSPAINAASNGSTTNGVTPPNASPDYFGATRVAPRDCGFHEFGGSGSNPGSLSASFTATPNSGAAPLVVVLADTSTATNATIDSRQWRINGVLVAEDVTLYEHTFTAAGTYTVELRVEASGSSLVDIASSTVTVSSSGSYALNPAFTQKTPGGATATGGPAPYRVVLEDTSAPTGGAQITSREWRGNGSGSSVVGTSNPYEHVYNAAGTYTPRLTVYDSVAAANASVNGSTITVIDPSDETTYDAYVAASSDDAGQASGGTMHLTTVSLRCGGTTDARTHVGFRFLNLPFASAVTVLSATLSVYVPNTSGDSPNLRIYGHKVADSGTFTSTANDLSGRALTTAYTTWSGTNLGGARRYELDVTAVVQEVLNQGGWASGNALSLIMVDQGGLTGEGLNMRTWDHDPTLAARLTVVVEEPAASGQHTASAAASTDDARQSGGSGTVTTDTTNCIMASSNTWSGHRWPNVNIPQGATITSAVMRIYVHNTTYDDVNWNIYLEDTDNAAAFTTSANNISGRSKTSAVTWSATALGTGYKSTPDLASKVQAVIDRPGWVSGNALAVLANNVDTTEIRFYHYDNGSNVPDITIDWEIEEGGGGGTPVKGRYYYRLVAR